MTTKKSILVLLVGLVSQVNAIGDYVAVMDLSYKPQLSAERLAKVVCETVANQQERPTAVEVDVSCSELGNEGIAMLIQDLLNVTESVPLGLSLMSKMNRLSPQGVAAMLNSILGADETEKKDDKSTTSSQPSLFLQTLDLGWNNLAPGQTGSKDLLSSLRRLIEDPDLCPSVLRLYRCGLGPAACRAIGKVCTQWYMEHVLLS